MKGMAVLGAASALPTIFVPEARAAWARKTPVHPNVDNLRVVSVTDTAMTRQDSPGIPWERQEALVNSKVVWENLDRLACALTRARNETDAWRTVFLKPPRKSWSDAVVAVKTNHIYYQHTRSAVMSRVCHVFTDILGVKGSNLHIYDACHGRSMDRDTRFKGLPEGVRIQNTWGGSTTLTPIPEPWHRGRDEASCLRHLVNGTVDILVNISMCKGHDSTFGGFTMTMKNHFGTFDPRYGHQREALEYLLAINLTREILGPMDQKTGKVLYPRQQLCIVDALWSSKPGPGGNPSDQTNFLAMGVLSPVVDYQVATKFRAERMRWGLNPGVTRRMLTEFGYAEADLPEGGKLLEI
ncbi:MAG: hypothetical protein AB1512_32695 [Thermodesulfobacteriota bacterium]